MKRIGTSVWVYAVPVILLLSVTLPHLSQGDFRVETAHYGAIGVQAWRDPGLFWTLHEHPAVVYFNKPPLVFWIHGLVLHLFGISLAAVRIPTILAAAGCVLITTSLARRFIGRATALAAGSILALSYEFFRRTREISLDMWQLFFMLLAVWLWALAAQTGRRRLAWLAGIPVGLALLCKPLMGFMVPLILLVWLFTGNARRPPRPVDLAGCVLMALLVALPWHGSMIFTHGRIFLEQYFGHEVGQRLQGLINHKPYWYYAKEIGKTYWPWMVLLAAGLVRWARGGLSPRHRSILKGAFIWIVIWVAVLSLFPDKRPRYALPLYPMMAILAGYGWAALPWRFSRTWVRKGLPLTAVVAVTLAATVAALPIRFQAPPDPELSALVEWTTTQNPAQVYSAALSAVDESMIYLKAGYWPIPLSSTPRPPAGSLLIYTDSLEPRPDSGAPCIFQAAPYRVIRYP